MRKTPTWRRYLRFWGSDPAADVEDELSFHFAMRVEDLMRRGQGEAEARAEAAREFGDLDRVRGELREIGRRRDRRERRARWWEGVGQDVRFGARTLARAPGFTAVVALTLALGIGGTTAVFTVIRGVLLAPLPYDDPGRLVRVYQHNETDTAPHRAYVTGPHFAAVRDEASVFSRAAAMYTYSETGLDLSIDGRAERLRVLQVSADYFTTLGVDLVLGRGFDRAQETGERLVILREDLWRTRFGHDPGIIGEAVMLHGVAHTVVGIVPEGFRDPVVGEVEAWLPLDLLSEGTRNPDNHFLTVLARLRPGATPEQARAALGTVSRAVAERWPAVADDTLVMVPLKEDLVGGSRAMLRLLLLAVGLVLLIACVNVANLFLVRSSGRGREFAIRSALGSGGARITRQLLVESLLLAAAGGALGLLIARVGVDALLALGRDAIPRAAEVGFEPAIVAFAAAVTLATGIAFGAAPALRFARVRPGGALREQDRSVAGPRAGVRLRGGLAAAQLALALVLLSGAGILMASFHRLQQVELGFRTDDVLTFEVSLPPARYDAGRRAEFREQLDRRIAALPEVSASGGISRLPATGTYHSWSTQAVTGPRAGSDRPWVVGEQRVVSGRIFDALGIPLLAGRVFDDRDHADAPAVAVVSAAFAREAFPGVPLRDVVGQRIAPAGREREVIGVVGDIALGPRGDPAPAVYQAHRQFAANRNWVLTHAVASDIPPSRLLPRVRAELAALDPELVLHRPMPLADVVGRGISRDRFAFALMGAFAAVALTLAALGLYGVLSYTVRQRTREIGIRVALGATATGIRKLVLRQAAALTTIGILLGTAGALALGRVLAALVFRMRPWDPAVLTATALLLATVALVAAALPARRAARIQPRVAMEQE